MTREYNYQYINIISLTCPTGECSLELFI